MSNEVFNVTAFYFVRHAESKKNLRDITGGTGEALTEKGIEQVDLLYNNTLKKILPQKFEIRSNRIVQVEQTARLLSQKFCVENTVDDKLKPAGMGIINGLSRAQVQKDYPDISHQMTRWRNGEIEACDLVIEGMEDPISYWNNMVEHILSLCDGTAKVIVCSRSIMVWAYNFAHCHRPTPGGGYKHVTINNCDMISFFLSDNSSLPVLISEFTTENLRTQHE